MPNTYRYRKYKVYLLHAVKYHILHILYILYIYTGLSLDNTISTSKFNETLDGPTINLYFIYLGRARILSHVRQVRSISIESIIILYILTNSNILLYIIHQCLKVYNMNYKNSFCIPFLVFLAELLYLILYSSLAADASRVIH